MSRPPVLAKWAAYAKPASAAAVAAGACGDGGKTARPEKGRAIVSRLTAVTRATALAASVALEACSAVGWHDGVAAAALAVVAAVPASADVRPAEAGVVGAARGPPAVRLAAAENLSVSAHMGGRLVLAAFAVTAAPAPPP